MATVTVYLTQRERRRRRAKAAGAAMIAFVVGVVMTAQTAQAPAVETRTIVRTETVVQYVAIETSGPPSPPAVEEKQPVRRRLRGRAEATMPRPCCL